MRYVWLKWFSEQTAAVPQRARDLLVVVNEYVSLLSVTQLLHYYTLIINFGLQNRASALETKTQYESTLLTNAPLNVAKTSSVCSSAKGSK
jgi:hypothetical protein